ncbi:unnamed protein product [Psylliodes chrysocephalus]|uniref:Uncharacterized protein n=1 Tax=Psylliodes chrysocephalus TaxID=3402493 RepID=A0A9P0DCA7_9CUCU|nr:unnamed protein product [Psylliodes chrysocephala]
MHLNCTDLKADDRVTRQKLRCIKIVCNRCSSIIDQFSEVKGILETFKINIVKKVDSFDDKHSIISYQYLRTKLKIPNLFVLLNLSKLLLQKQLMRQAKNILIREIAEAQGDSAVKKEHDKEKLGLILSSLGSTAEMVSFYGIRKPNSNNKYPRMIKVTFQCESDALFFVRIVN